MSTKSVKIDFSGTIPVLETSGDYYNSPYLDLFISDNTAHVYLMNIISGNPLPEVEFNLQLDRFGALDWEGPYDSKLFDTGGIVSIPKILTEIDKGVYRIRLSAKGPLAEAAECSFEIQLLIVKAYTSQIISV